MTVPMIAARGKNGVRARIHHRFTEESRRSSARFSLGRAGVLHYHRCMPAERPRDCIVIEELEVNARIGVPEAERAAPQRLTLSLTLWPTTQFGGLEDELAKTVNYSAVARAVQEFVGARADKLIETLADGIASHLLEEFPLQRVRIELRKFVLPDAKFVAAICERRA
jgi:dihydroneopterin aldolase